MRVKLRLLLAASLLLASSALIVRAQDAKRAEPSKAAKTAAAASPAPLRAEDDKDKKDKDKTPPPAPPPTTLPTVSDPLLRMLVMKNVITPEEARAVGVGTIYEQRDRLAALLRDKGLLTPAEFESLRAAPIEGAGSATLTASAAQQSQGGQGQPGNQKPEGPATQPRPAAPAVIPAVAPIRALQYEASKRDGLLPVIKLASGAKLSPYGFFKTSIVSDSSSQQGNDFPLPGFLGDTGPRNSPEFHIKARSFRMGANFEWLDPSPKTTITGRIEFDFEGNFSRVNNRNISSIRSSMPSIRLAWVRIDRAFSDRTSGFALFGQDWTPFGSSTLPNLVETTGLGIGFGTLYERLPQARFGINYKLGGARNFSIQPEFALVLPAVGNLPADLTNVNGGITEPNPNGEGIGNQLGYGERQGPDSNRPEIQGRVVLQFQLDKSPGVVPAQLIASFMQGSRRAIVTRALFASAVNASSLSPADKATLLNSPTFASGAQVDSDTNGYTIEAQLPTRFVTAIGKYYSGSDLRFYFAGQLFSNYNDTFGLTSTVSAQSIDAASSVVFGLRNGVPDVAPQRPVRARGGFINLGFPLSRIFDADPKGRAAGFTAYLHYGFDQAEPRDVRRIGAANRGRGDLFAGSLQYKMNQWVTFAYEQSLYRTRAVNNAGALPLFRGIPSRETHDIRSEFATIFTF